MRIRFRQLTVVCALFALSLTGCGIDAVREGAVNGVGGFTESTITSFLSLYTVGLNALLSALQGAADAAI